MKTANRQQLLVIGVAVVVGLFLADKMILTPLSALWDKRAQEIKGLRSKIADGKLTIRREPAIVAQWDRMRTNTLSNIQSRAQENLLNAFKDWAQESGVTLDAFTPQWKNESDEYKTLVCNVDVKGNLWMLTRFIYDIESAPLGLKVESATFNSQNNGQEVKLGLQVSGLVLASQQ